MEPLLYFSYEGFDETCAKIIYPASCSAVYLFDNLIKCPCSLTFGQAFQGANEFRFGFVRSSVATDPIHCGYQTTQEL